VFVGGFDFALRPVVAHSPVRVEFAYDLSGVIRVTVAQVGTDNEKTVALSLPHAHATEKHAAPTAPHTSPVERKARRLLEAPDGRERVRLQALLDDYTRAPHEDREAEEEALLDFILDAESDE
jgi:molecular chaperone DnaK